MDVAWAQGCRRLWGGIARERPVILVADAEDTAREMYMKQGYTFVSFQYSALKELTVSVSY